jgi:hypothetical protein
MLDFLLKPFLNIILKLEIRIMSSLDTLKNAVAQVATDQGNLATAVAGVSTDVQAILQKLNGLSASTVTDSDLDALSASLTTVDQGLQATVTTLDASKEALDGALAPPPAPAPAPAPSP